MQQQQAASLAKAQRLAVKQLQMQQQRQQRRGRLARQEHSRLLERARSPRTRLMLFHLHCCLPICDWSCCVNLKQPQGQYHGTSSLFAKRAAKKGSAERGAQSKVNRSASRQLLNAGVPSAALLAFPSPPHCTAC